MYEVTIDLSNMDKGALVEIDGLGIVRNGEPRVFATVPDRLPTGVKVVKTKKEPDPEITRQEIADEQTYREALDKAVEAEPELVAEEDES